MIDTQGVPLDPQVIRRLERAASKLDAARAERDTLIVQAVKAGGGVREVARSVGLSHPTVMGIVARAEAPQTD